MRWCSVSSSTDSSRWAASACTPGSGPGGTPPASSQYGVAATGMTVAGTPRCSSRSWSRSTHRRPLREGVGAVDDHDDPVAQRRGGAQQVELAGGQLAGGAGHEHDRGSAGDGPQDAGARRRPHVGDRRRVDQDETPGRAWARGRRPRPGAGPTGCRGSSRSSPSADRLGEADRAPGRRRCRPSAGSIDDLRPSYAVGVARRRGRRR